MAFPQVHSRLTQNWATATSSFDVSMPTSVVSGNLLLIFFNVSDGTTLSIPSGWTLLDDKSTGAFRSNVYAKVADGSEGGTQVTVTPGAADEAAAVVYQISDWGGTISSDIDDAANRKPAGTAEIICNEVTAGWGLADNLFFAVGFAGNDDATILETPANYTDKTEVQAGGGTNAGCTVVVTERELAASSDTPRVSGQTYSFLLSEAEDWNGYTLVVEPGASGGEPAAPAGGERGLAHLPFPSIAKSDSGVGNTP